MAALPQARLRRVVAVVDLLLDAADEESLLPALLPLVLRAVPGDSLVWAVRPDPSGRPLTLPAALVGSALLEAFRRTGPDDPLVVHTTLGSGLPMRRSDLQAPREYHALGCYAEVYRPLGIEQQLAMAFPAGRLDGAPRSVCLVVNRSGADFGETDLAAARLLLGRLARAMRRLAPPPPARDGVTPLDGEPVRDTATPRVGVTPREAAVLDLLARGLADQQIAHRLAISPRTVDKHLEHAYAKLHVHGRVEAAMLWLGRR